MYNALSLFSGIGGLDLAAESAGFKTVAFAEKDEYCRRVLKKHWPDITLFDDVKSVDTSLLPKIELIHAGYPCQPFSLAGKRRGHADNRHLWPEMLRLVRELNPNWIVGENVVGHVTLGLDEVIDDLENAGYATRAYVYPACAVGAAHTRQRLFIVAHATGVSRDDPRIAERGGGTALRGAQKQTGGLCCSIRGYTSLRKEVYQPRMDRVTNGLPHRVDRLRCLGNAVVPQQAYPIFAAIAETYNAEVTGLGRNRSNDER